MGILYDLCIAIDTHNSSKDIDKKGLINYIRIKREEKSIKKIINRIIIQPKSLKNSLIDEFIYTYNSTKDTIHIEGLESGFSEETNILWLKYTHSKSSISVVLNHKDTDRISVRFEDLTPGTYPVSFNVYETFCYEGIDKKRLFIMNYANDAFRTFMRDYFILRIK